MASPSGTKRPAAAIFLSGEYRQTEHREGISEKTKKPYVIHNLNFLVVRPVGKALTPDIAVSPELIATLPNLQPGKSYLVPVTLGIYEKSVQFRLAPDYPIVPAPEFPEADKAN